MERKERFDNDYIRELCRYIGASSDGEVEGQTLLAHMEEAEEHGIITLQRNIEVANEEMFARLRGLLDEGVPLHEIPEIMKTLNDKPSWLTNFNYDNFYYL